MSSKRKRDKREERWRRIAEKRDRKRDKAEKYASTPFNNGTPVPVELIYGVGPFADFPCFMLTRITIKNAKKYRKPVRDNTIKIPYAFGTIDPRLLRLDFE